MGRLDGRLALVSGAAQGLGRAIATRLAAEGARLAVNDRRPSPELDRLAAETAGVTAVADVSDPDAVDAMVAEVERAHGPVEVLVANHAYMSMRPFVEHNPEDWWRNVDVNLSGTFFLLRAVLPGMRRNGGGRIVIIASEFGVVGWANATAYAASKTGLISLTKTLGRELGPENILVNAIAPGIMDTPQLDVDPGGDPAPLRGGEPDGPHRAPGGDRGPRRLPQHRRRRGLRGADPAAQRRDDPRVGLASHSSG